MRTCFQTGWEQLHLEGCGLGSASALRLAELLGTDHCLQRLALSHNPGITGQPAMQLAEAAATSTSLRELSGINLALLKQASKPAAPSAAPSAVAMLDASGLSLGDTEAYTLAMLLTVITPLFLALLCVFCNYR